MFDPQIAGWVFVVGSLWGGGRPILPQVHGGGCGDGNEGHRRYGERSAA